MTHGDFCALAGKIRFISQNKISGKMIADELCKIQDEKACTGRQIGFTVWYTSMYKETATHKQFA